MADLKEVKKSSGENAKSMTPEEMKEILRLDKAARESRAAEGIKKVLEAERCILNPIVVLSTGKVDTKLEILAVD